MATIKQTVKFAGATAKQLYQLYADPKKHAAVTGAKAKIAAKAGTSFSVFGGQITGKTLQAKPNKLLVQSWRYKDWGVKAEDSILVLSFSDGALELVHTNVPDAHAAAVKSGWTDHYWAPWKAALKDGGSTAGAKKAAAKKAGAKKSGTAKATARGRAAVAKKTTVPRKTKAASKPTTSKVTTRKAAPKKAAAKRVTSRAAGPKKGVATRRGARASKS